MTLSPSVFRFAALLVGLALLVAFPAVAPEFYLQLFSKIMIMGIFAMGLNLLVGYTGLVSFGHAAFFGVGAYVLYLLSPEYAPASLFTSLPIAVIAAAVTALVIGFLALRSTGVYFIMATLALSQMLYFFVMDSDWLGGSDGSYIYYKPQASLFGFVPFDLEAPVHFYYVLLVLALAVAFMINTLLRSPFGHVLAGIKANEQRMRSLGYATFRYKMVIFVIAGALGGLAGYFDAAQYGFVSPELFAWRQSGLVLMMVILGGMGTRFGPFLGAATLILLQDLFADRAVFGDFAKHWHLTLGLFIIFVVFALPDGVSSIGRRVSKLLSRSVKNV